MAGGEHIYSSIGIFIYIYISFIFLKYDLSIAR